MSVTPRLPDDPGECQRLLEDLLRRNAELRQQAEQQSEESAAAEIQQQSKTPNAASMSSNACSIRPRRNTTS